MFNLNIADNLLTGLSQSMAVRPDRCIRMNHKSAKCSLCETNCPIGAIKVGTVGTSIEIDWAKCTSCGICINICHSNVYNMPDTNYPEFLDNYIQKISADGSLHIVCKKSNINTDTAVVECIGMLGLADILHFYTNGANRITLCFSDCAKCVNKFGYEIIEDDIAELKTFMANFEHLKGTEITIADDNIQFLFTHRFEKPAPLANIKKKEKQTNPVSRRGIFNLLRKDATDAILRSAPLLASQELPTKTLFNQAKELPIKRKIFLDSIVKCGKLLDTNIKVGTYFYSQKIADKCVLCKVCTRFCNTGALFTSDDDKQLLFNSANCTSCGMCLQSCYHGNITIQETLDLRTLFDDVIKVQK